MGRPQNLRSILSQNIRRNRTSLHLTQVKLAEYAKISVPHMLDIEYCKTWVSDNTLNKIARVLDVEAYELLIPEQPKEVKKPVKKKKKSIMRKASDLIYAKKRELTKKTGETLSDLVHDLITALEDIES